MVLPPSLYDKDKEYKFVNEEPEMPPEYIEAEKEYGITKSRFSRAIGELLAKGFISIAHRGGGYKQDKSIYALSDKWMLWQPGTVFETREKVKVQRGFCKPKTKVTLESVPIHSHENVPIQETLG